MDSLEIPDVESGEEEQHQEPTAPFLPMVKSLLEEDGQSEGPGRSKGRKHGQSHAVLGQEPGGALIKAEAQHHQGEVRGQKGAGEDDVVGWAKKRVKL